MRRDKFILAILGYVSLNAKMDRKDFKELGADLYDNLPAKSKLKKQKHINRTFVEEFLSGNYQVRVYTKTAEAIRKLL